MEIITIDKPQNISEQYKLELTKSLSDLGNRSCSERGSLKISESWKNIASSESQDPRNFDRIVYAKKDDYIVCYCGVKRVKYHDREICSINYLITDKGNRNHNVTNKIVATTLSKEYILSYKNPIFLARTQNPFAYSYFYSMAERYSKMFELKMDFYPVIESQLRIFDVPDHVRQIARHVCPDHAQIDENLICKNFYSSFGQLYDDNLFQSENNLIRKFFERNISHSDALIMIADIN